MIGGLELLIGSASTIRRLYERFAWEAIHASCEDFRASPQIDLEMDEADEKAGRKIEAALLALWGGRGSVGGLWDVLDVWRRCANGPVKGRSLEAGHYHLAEEQPEEVLGEMQRFFVEWGDDYELQKD